LKVLNKIMDFQYQHDKIINKFRSVLFSEGDYFERHHIIPRCMGGSDDETNIIRLTPKAHFTIHHLLCKIHPGNSKLASAFHLMCYHTSPNRKIGTNNRLFDIARKNYSLYHHSKDNLFKEKLSNRMVGFWKDESYRKNHKSIIRSVEKWSAIYDDVSIPHKNGYPFCVECGDMCRKRNMRFCSKMCFDQFQKENFYRNSEDHTKMVLGIRDFLSSLNEEEKIKRLSRSLHSDRVDHVARGEKISNSKRGKSTNQYEIMGRKYANMSDNEFEKFIRTKSPRSEKKLKNLRNKWKIILQ